MTDPNADDQALVRTGFRAIVSHEPELDVVGEAGDGRQALELARLHRPDVVLMDIRMPGIYGLEATRLLTANHSTARVLNGCDAAQIQSTALG